MTPQPGDFALVRISGYVGLLIRIAQWLNGSGARNYEHAFIVMPNNTLVEAEPGGARRVGDDEYAGSNVLYSSWNLTDRQRGLICYTAQYMVSTPYSALDYVALALHRLRIPAPWLRRYIESQKHVICSQLVTACYEAAGLKMFSDGRWDGYVTPGDLEAVLTGPK